MSAEVNWFSFLTWDSLLMFAECTLDGGRFSMMENYLRLGDRRKLYFAMQKSMHSAFPENFVIIQSNWYDKLPNSERALSCCKCAKRPKLFDDCFLIEIRLSQCCDISPNSHPDAYSPNFR